MSQAFYSTNDGHIGNLARLSVQELTDLIDRQTSLLKKKNFIQKLPDKGQKNKDLLERLNRELATRKSSSSTNNISEKTKVAIDKKDKVDSEVVDLDIALDRLRVNDTNSSTGEKAKHFFEIAEERFNQNEKDMRKFKRLNQYINACHVEDCPDEIKAMQPPRSNITDKTVLPEESAAVPPCYKYEGAQIIPLDESLHLQKAQKEKLDKIQAVTAAQRLSKSLGIKMEEYRPEGVDMSYRGATQEIESDSDDEKQENIYDEGDDAD